MTFIKNISKDLKMKVTSFLRSFHHGKHSYVDSTKFARSKNQKEHSGLDDKERNFTVEYKEVKLFQFLSRIFFDVQSLAEQNQIEFEFQYTTERELSVQLDARTIEEVLCSLISNVFRNAKAGDHVSFRASFIDETLRIEVEEYNAYMIELNEMEIFDQHDQSVLSGMKTASSVIELGCAHEMTKAMGGSLSYKNESKHGRRFRLDIPVMSPA